MPRGPVPDGQAGSRRRCPARCPRRFRRRWPGPVSTGRSISSSGRSRPMGEDRYRARLGRHGPRVTGRGVRGPSRDLVGELGNQPGDLHRVPAVWQVPGAVKHHQFTAAQLGQPPSPAHRLAAVIGAVQDAHRAAHPAAQRLGLACGRRGSSFPFGDHRLGVGLQRPAHRVLVLLGGMRLGQLLAEEELNPLPVAAVLPPEVPVAHAPFHDRACVKGDAGMSSSAGSRGRRPQRRRGRRRAG